MTALACDLTTLEAGQRQQRQALAKELFGQVRQTRELENGYAWSFRGDDVLWLKLAELVGFERHCCPLLVFGLELDGQEMWLRLTGPEGVKGFLKAQFQGG